LHTAISIDQIITRVQNDNIVPIMTDKKEIGEIVLQLSDYYGIIFKEVYNSKDEDIFFRVHWMFSIRKRDTRAMQTLGGRHLEEIVHSIVQNRIENNLSPLPGLKICYLKGDKLFEITSKDGGQWILQKGHFHDFIKKIW